MKSIYKTLCLVFAVLFTGCAQGDNDMNYKIQDVTEIEFKIESGVLQLSYAPILESLYYSPGINYLIHDDYMIINLVRCNINDECEVDAKASQGAVNVVNIEMERVFEPEKIFINEPKKTNNITYLALHRG